MKIINAFLNLFREDPAKKYLTIYFNQPTIAQAFDYPKDDFEKLVNELTFVIKPEDRIKSFTQYIQSPFFAEYKLDVNNPNHAAILGYAFCLAIVMAHELHHQTLINDMLSKFGKQSVN